MCPHKKAFVLSRGILGDAAGVPKVACPLHKKTFSLETGQSITGEEYHVQTFAVKVEDDGVYLHLPPAEELDNLLATEIGCKLATLCHSANGSNGHHAGPFANGAATHGDLVTACEQVGT
jgi:hypothetical protein